MNKRDKRPITGILLLDKENGLTSNQALQQVKRLFNASKAGHTGSLDPLATGMLPICLGAATKFSEYLLHANKTYQVIAQLGIKTTTGDKEGEIIQTRQVPLMNQNELNQVLNTFLGTTLQVPSMYSALKLNGQPLYKLARQGISVERASRQISIYSFKLLNFSAEQFELELQCSSGTYVRTLIEDIGEILGCGAHVTMLRRLQVGSYLTKQMISFKKLEQNHQRDELLLPIDSALTQYPELILEKNLCLRLYQGQSIPLPPFANNKNSHDEKDDNKESKEKLFRLYQETGQFIGLGFLNSDHNIISKKLMPASLT